MGAICLFWSYGCLQGGEPSSNEHLIIAHLSKAIEFRAHINSLEKKVKVACKKVADLKKKLLKASEVFKEVDKEIEHLHY